MLIRWAVFDAISLARRNKGDGSTTRAAQEAKSVGEREKRQRRSPQGLPQASLSILWAIAALSRHMA